MFSRTPLVRVATTIALVVVAGGCCSGVTERNSEAVVSPGGLWKSAYATVEYHPSFYKHGRKNAPRVTQTISINQNDDGINRAYVILSQASEQDYPSKVFRELRDTTYTLRFAPDAHALAASTDSGKHWTIFDLEVLTDSTLQPFWCPHRSATSLAPWPSTKALALDVLAAADASSPAGLAHRGPSAVDWPSGVAARGLHWSNEWEGASRHACLKRDDPELRAAVVEAYLQPGPGYYSGPVGRCIRELAKAHEPLRARLVAARATADEHARRRIDDALRDGTPPAK